VSRKKRKRDYDYLLDKISYKNKDDIRRLLKSVYYLISLSEEGVSSALCILADLSKAITCSVDGYRPLTREEFEAIYYAYICDYGIYYASVLCGCGIKKMYTLTERALDKLAFILGEDDTE
jgi:hypothetical protein